ncbi:MAG: calcium-binding protein [Pseudomonadota bacterium]
MLNIKTTQSFFALTENDLSVAQNFELSLYPELLVLDNLGGAWTPRSVTSTRVVMEQAGNLLTVDGLSLTGISNFSQLEEAVANISASGDVTNIFLEDASGALLFEINFTQTGVMLTSGAQSLQVVASNLDSLDDVDRLNEALAAVFPRSFRFLTSDDESTLTATQGRAELEALGVTGMRMMDGPFEALDVTITPTLLMIRSDGYETRVTGTFDLLDLDGVYALLAQVEVDLAAMVRNTDVLSLSPVYASFPITQIEVRSPTEQLLLITGDIAGAAMGTQDQASSLWLLEGGASDDVLTYRVDAPELAQHRLDGLAGDDQINVDLDLYTAEQARRVADSSPALALQLDGDAGTDTVLLTTTGAVDLDVDLGAGTWSAGTPDAGTITSIERVIVDTAGTADLTLAPSGGTVTLIHAVSFAMTGSTGVDQLDLSAYELRDGAGTVLQTNLALSDYIANGFFVEAGPGGVYTANDGSISFSDIDQLVLADGVYDPLVLEGDSTSGATAGGDVIGNTGSTGDQVLNGGGGDDFVNGGAGNDTLRGGVGDDRLVGATGADTLFGGDGADILNGGDGDDFIFGGDTEADLRDVVFAGGGNDMVEGGYGNDDLYGMDGNDSIDGGPGADTLQGQNGDDVLSGGATADQIFGNAGSDFINGGFGSDRLNGGSGADRFYHQGDAGHGSDWIQDYSALEGDVLLVALPGAGEPDFQVNITNTAGAGEAGVDEAFVIYRPTGQILFALVDGAAQTEINLRIAGSTTTWDLL